jgi:hypothetical protein
MTTTEEQIQTGVEEHVETGIEEHVQPVTEVKKKLLTEDLGKMFEMAICLTFNIPYDGKYKYGMELPEQLKQRLAQLVELFPMCSHTAKKGARYDYTSIDGTTHLSAKTNKKGKKIGRVAPQVIGQAQPQKFCDILGIELTTIPDLKEFIQANINVILPVLTEHTFDCPNLYFNQNNNTIQYIVLSSQIEWETYQFKWTNDWKKTGSSTLKIVIGCVETALVEFQFHSGGRSNMAIRWFYDNFINIFKNNLTITNL